MNEYESLSHTTWDCKYHVVFIPKCRRKTLYQELRRHLGQVFPQTCASEGGIEGRRRASDPDHVHSCWRSRNSRVAGGCARRDPLGQGFGERKRNFVGQHFWARGFFVNTIGRDEAIRAYIRNQEKEDQRLEQMNLWR